MWTDPLTPRAETRTLKGMLFALAIGKPLRDHSLRNTATLFRSKQAVAARPSWNPCRDWPGWYKLFWRLLLGVGGVYAWYWHMLSHETRHLLFAIGFGLGGIGVLVLGFQVFNGDWGKRRVEKLPAIVRYDPDLSGVVHIVPLGKTWKFKLVTIDLLKDPHLLVSADTGQGKSSLMTLVATWVRKHGGSVNIIDPKKIVYLFLRGIQGVDVWTETEEWIEVVDRFYLSMMETYDPARLTMEPELLGEGEPLPEKPFHLLQIDEMGTFIDAIEKDWQRKKGKGRAPTLDKLAVILWLGRAASHCLMVGAHQANARVVLSTDSRAQFRNTLGLGPQNALAARQLFGEKRPYKPKKRIGRGLLYSGGDFTDIQAWFIEMTEFPKITHDQQKVMAELKTCLPVRVIGHEDTQSLTASSGVNVIGQMTTSQDDDLSIRTPEMERVIKGRKMGAEYLGMKLEAFTQARNRKAIPGEQRDGNIPYWYARDLDAWRGNRGT